MILALSQSNERSGESAYYADILERSLLAYQSMDVDECSDQILVLGALSSLAMFLLGMKEIVALL